MPGGGMGTVAIELPAEWDALSGALGYSPLQSFYLSEDDNGGSTAGIKHEMEGCVRVRTDYFDTAGRKTSPRRRSMYIRRDTCKDGKTTAIKRIDK